MKKRTSRLLSSLLVLCMVLALLPGTAWAAGKPLYDTIDIYVSNKKVWQKKNGLNFEKSIYSYGLLDLEGDGIPELFLSGMGGTGFVSQNFFYKVDPETRSVSEMKDLPSGAELMDLLSGLEIYRDDQTGQLLYYYNDFLRNGWMENSTGYGFFYKQNGVVSLKALWGTKTTVNTSTYAETTTYYYYTAGGERVNAGEAAWKQYQKEYLSQYMLLAEDVPTVKAETMNAANDADLKAALRGMYDELYQSIGATSGAPAAGVSVTVKGKAVEWTDAKPFIDENNRTMVPLRAVGDALGLTVSWEKEAREAIFKSGTKMISFPIGSSIAHTSEGDVAMSTAAVIVGDRTYAPIRYLAEYFGYTVGWDGSTSTVSIT